VSVRSRQRRSVALRGVMPLLDTLFLLLFSLLALSDARTSNRAEPVRVRLPEVERGSEPSAPAARRVAIEIDARSAVWLADGAAPIGTHDELDRELTRRLGDGLPEELVVEIRADRDARSGVALDLLQHLLVRGFVNVQLLASGTSDPARPLGGVPPGSPGRPEDGR
jgi:biopolymer transport protein ExbD